MGGTSEASSKKEIELAEHRGGQTGTGTGTGTGPSRGPRDKAKDPAAAADVCERNSFVEQVCGASLWN